VHVPVSKYAEAFGQIYIESFAAGLPSVLTISGVAPSIAKHEYNCLVVPYKDSVSIAQALNQIRDHPELARKMGENARKTVVNSFTVIEKYKKLQKFYSDLCFNHV
jgi:glycosyltransferase involved in cell wall biosynthesis